MFPMRKTCCGNFKMSRPLDINNHIDWFLALVINSLFKFIINYFFEKKSSNLKLIPNEQYKSRTIKTSTNNKNYVLSSLSKIFVTHLQMIPMIKLINFNWEVYALDFLSVQTYFSDISQSASSLDCLISSFSNF